MARFEYTFADRANRLGIEVRPLEEKCSALCNAFTLNPDNSFSFCGIMSEPRFKFGFGPGDRAISEAFNEVINYREEVKRLYAESPCGNCRLANVCPGCPAHVMLENGGAHTRCNQNFKDGTLCKLMTAADAGCISNQQLLEIVHNIRSEGLQA